MKSIALLITLFAAAPCFNPLRAETLAEAAAAAGTDWMIGSWVSDDGNVTISYEWKLDRHAVGVKFKMGERESEGMILRKPGTETIIYGAADNKGGMTSGQWIEFQGEATLMSTHTAPDGKETKMAAMHTKVDDRTMSVKIYAVGSDGKPEGDAKREVTFKRQ